jgi:cbb3-type cytochrome oxidase subunit 3
MLAVACAESALLVLLLVLLAVVVVDNNKSRNRHFAYARMGALVCDCVDGAAKGHDAMHCGQNIN